MQFKRVVHSATGRERWVFAMTKWEATAFTIIGKNKKAPLDDQAVRFDVKDGRAHVWATDAVQLLHVEPSYEEDAPEPPDSSFACTATDLKKITQKATVANMVYFPTDEPVVLSGPKTDLVDGGQLVANVELGRLEQVPSLDRGVETLLSVLDAVSQNAEGAKASAVVSGRFAATLAAVAKATGEADLWTVFPAPSIEGPIVIRVGDEVDGALWTLAMAQMRPKSQI